MADTVDPIRARFGPSVPQAHVLSALVVVAGAQAGLSVERIQDAVMAVELLLGGGAARERTVGLAIHPGAMEVSVSDVAAGWLDGRRQMLDVLVSGIEPSGNGVRVRVEA
jgi:hypothetical protein